MDDVTPREELRAIVVEKVGTQWYPREVDRFVERLCAYLAGREPTHPEIIAIADIRNGHNNALRSAFRAAWESEDTEVAERADEH